MKSFTQLSTAVSSLIFISLVSCTQKKDVPSIVESPVVVEPVVQEPRVATGPCPDGIGATAGDQARVTVAVENGQLIVCGFEDETAIEPGRKHLSEFDVYSLIDGNLSKPIFTAGAVQNYQVYFETSELILEELIFYRGSLKPAFRFSITCRQGTCNRSPEKCILTRNPGAPGTEAVLAKLQKKATLTETDLDNLFNAALDGSKSAEAFFSNELHKGVKLDGANAETYSSHQAFIKRLANCDQIKKASK